ncbi:MAG: signal peptidase I [Chloroflexota bacterium]
MKSIVREVLWTLLFAVLVFVLLRVSVQTFRVEMPSMKPTIEPGWWLVLDKVSYRFGQPRRGDIVVFHAPTEPGHDFIKRVIAIPGDTVEVKDGKVYLNGQPVEEPYLANPPHYTMALWEIPPNEYFVLGDNRDTSVDSHYGWLVPRANLVGRAWLIVWPFSKWGLAPNHALSAGQVSPGMVSDVASSGPTLVFDQGEP